MLFAEEGEEPVEIEQAPEVNANAPKKIPDTVDTNALLRLGFELPEKFVLGGDSGKRLYAKGILAQCAYGGAKSVELAKGGQLAIGALGLEFDSNYVRSSTNSLVFSGGALAAFDRATIKSSAPILLESGTSSRIIVPHTLAIKSSFAGAGDLEVSGRGKVGFFIDSPRATGTLTLNGVTAAFPPGIRWGGKIVKKNGATIVGTPEENAKPVFPAPATAYRYAKMQREKLSRGVIAWRSDTNEVTISWRYLESDPVDIAFEVGIAPAGAGARHDAGGATQVTLPYDGKRHVYSVYRKGGKQPLGSMAVAANAPIGYLELPLKAPKPAKTPDGHDYTYFPEDCSVGDLDGDGEYELVVEWSPTLQGDNSSWHQTGETWLEGVKLDGTGRSLWKICLGPNVRAGSHYSPFMVYDFDGDGKAEVVVRTGDGARDGKGRILNDEVFAPSNRFKDWRVEDMHVVFAPTYVTVFRGSDGFAIDTLPFKPAVHNDPAVIARKDHKAVKKAWRARNAGNQAFRFLSAIAYLDGLHPSVVMCRGYYSRSCLWALDFDGKKLKERWFFDSDDPRWTGYGGQGNHNLRVGDVDFDGKDEIVYGAMTVDHDGSGLYTTALGHGDAIHLIQRTPFCRGLQVWDCHESCGHGVDLHDAATGEILFRRTAGVDTGTCNAADCDPRSPGVELFSGANVGFFSGSDFHCFARPKPNPRVNYYGVQRFGIWWKGDMTRQFYSGGSLIHDYDLKRRGVSTVADFGDEVTNNHWTKGAPCLIADLFGDWREEILLRTKDNSSIRIYPSPLPTAYRFHSFMYDPVYRISVATENAGYNMPPEPGFYFGPDLLGHDLLFRGMKLK